MGASRAVTAAHGQELDAPRQLDSIKQPQLAGLFEAEARRLLRFCNRCTDSVLVGVLDDRELMHPPGEWTRVTEVQASLPVQTALYSDFQSGGIGTRLYALRPYGSGATWISKRSLGRPSVT